MPALTCPSCAAELRFPDQLRGKKVKCPKCGRRFEITDGRELPDEPLPEALPAPPIPPPVPRALAKKRRRSRRAAAESAEVDTMPAKDWLQRQCRGSAPIPPLATSIPTAGDGHDVGFRCPYCGSRQLPQRRSKISAGGWVMFWILLLFLCFPLCWIGLLMKEEYLVCYDCGIKLG
jgi:DNA-directed RNA polymerase subunit RPC12/RpoP